MAKTNKEENQISEHERLIREHFMGYVSRSVAVDEKVINKDDRSVRTVIATETPSLVWDWEEWRVIREILIVENDSVIQPMNSKIVMLDSHRSWGGVKEIIKGSIRDLHIENHEYVGQSVFASRAEDEWQLAVEGHLDATSIGYRTFREHTEILRHGTSSQINGRTFTNDFGDKRDLYIRKKWQPLEGSMVAIGADSMSGYRSAGAFFEFLQVNNRTIPNQIPSSKTNREHITMEDDDKTQGQQQQTQAPGQRTQETESKEDTLKKESERRKEIRAIGKRFSGRIKDIDKLLETAEDGLWPIERLNAEIVTRMSAGEEFAQPATDLDLDNKDKKRYSMWNLIRSVLEKNPDLAGLEREASREIAKRLGRTPNGFFIEYGSLKREITVGAGTADKLVATELMVSNFLDLLYSRMIFGRDLNVKMITGLVGDLDFPRKTSSSRAYYINEGGIATESDINFGSEKMSPKTVSAKVKYSRKTGQQTSLDMEALVIEDIINAINLRTQEAYIQGAGGDEPLGLLFQDGVQLFDGANFSFDSAVDMETLLDDMNIPLDQAAWLTTPLVKGALRKKRIEAGQVEKLCMGDRMLERRVLSTKMTPANNLALFDPSEIIIGVWGILDLQINRLNDDGGVKVIPFWDHDFINRRSIGTVKTTNFSL